MLVYVIHYHSNDKWYRKCNNLVPLKLNYFFGLSTFITSLCYNPLVDGSDWQQTDAEDQRKNKVHSRASEHTGTSPPGQNQEPGWRNPGNPTLTLAGPVYPPIYVVKDMVCMQVESCSHWTHKAVNVPVPLILLFVSSCCFHLLPAARNDPEKKSAALEK